MNSYQNFQQIHQLLTGCLESLLKKGEHILVKDLKMIKDQIIIWNTCQQASGR